MRMTCGGLWNQKPESRKRSLPAVQEGELPEEKPRPLTGRERAAKHRARQAERDLQVAVGVSRLLTGSSPGEQGKALLELLRRTAARPGLPGDYRSLLEEAIDALSARRRR